LVTNTDPVRINRILKTLVEQKVVGKIKDDLGRVRFPSATAAVDEAVQDFLAKYAIKGGA